MASNNPFMWNSLSYKWQVVIKSLIYDLLIPAFFAFILFFCQQLVPDITNNPLLNLIGYALLIATLIPVTFLIRGCLLFIAVIFYTIIHTHGKWFYLKVKSQALSSRLYELETGADLNTEFSEWVLQIFPKRKKSKKMEKKAKPKREIKLNWKVIGIVFIVLMILNPGLSQFKEYSDDKRSVKKFNFLIVSVYDSNGNVYLGFLLNFVKVGRENRGGYVEENNGIF